MRILVVDDDYVSRVKLKSILSQYGDCDAVSNGEMALQMIQAAFNEGVPYTVITMDIDMPDMSGLEVVEKIRGWEMQQNIDTNESVKILMVTIKTDAKNIVSSFSKGCEWFVKKPVTKENIKEALLKAGVVA